MSMPADSLQPSVRQAGEHERLAYTGGAELAVILDAALTGGQLTVIESHSRRGDASPVHVRHHDDEAFLLLDGQMTVRRPHPARAIRRRSAGPLPRPARRRPAHYTPSWRGRTGRPSQEPLLGSVGVTIADPDGYRLVLGQRSWP